MRLFQMRIPACRICDKPEGMCGHQASYYPGDATVAGRFHGARPLVECICHCQRNDRVALVPYSQNINFIDQLQNITILERVSNWNVPGVFWGQCEDCGHMFWAREWIP